MSQGWGLRLGDVPAVLDVLDVVLPGFRRSWGHARGCGQALMRAGRMWGSRGHAPGQGRPYILVRVPWSLMVLGQRLTCVQCMSNASGTRLDVQRIGGGGEDDGVGAGGGDCVSGQLRVVLWALGSGTRVRDAVGAPTTTVRASSASWHLHDVWNEGTTGLVARTAVWTVARMKWAGG